MQNERIVKAAYYLVAIGFLWDLLFTNAGNYFHGGTPAEWVVLQTVGVLIVAAARWLVPKVRKPEKVLVILCAAAAFISVVWALIEIVRR